MKAGIRPGDEHDLAALRSIGVTGSPLSPDGFGWVYDAVKRDVWLVSMSGGTDVVSAFVGGCPWLPVHAGELQARALGAKVEAFDPDGRSVVGQTGELVLTAPLPSMPVFFWNDPDGTRYRESYFEMYPGVWRHGDWIRITERGSAVIEGRSDSTLNRQGIRFGTSELYGVVERLPEVVDSLVIGLELPDGRYWMPLFVVLAEGVDAGRRDPRPHQRRDPDGALAAARPRRDHRDPRRPADADRQEDGGAGQAAAPGPALVGGRGRRAPSPIRTPSTSSSTTNGSRTASTADGPGIRLTELGRLIVEDGDALTRKASQDSARSSSLSGLSAASGSSPKLTNEPPCVTTRGRADSGACAGASPERFLTTVLMTDIVESTQHAAELGDSAWRELVKLHHGLVRAALRRNGGREIDTAGDGFFAVFDAPAAAVECALQICREVRGLGIEIRAGAHVGEVEQVGRKVAGITVPIASRIMSLAGPGEVLVSATVRDLAAGARLRFEDRGNHSLKGVPGTWQVFAVSAVGEAVGATQVRDDGGVAVEEGARRRAAAVRRAQSRPIWQRYPRAVSLAILGVAAVAIGAGLLIWKPWQPAALAGIDENALGIIDGQRSEIVASIGIGAPPGAMAAADDAVWITNAATNTVSRVDIASHAVTREIDVGRSPAGIAVAGGSIWVTNSGERIGLAHQHRDDARGRYRVRWQRPVRHRGRSWSRMGCQRGRQHSRPHR